MGAKKSPATGAVPAQQAGSTAAQMLGQQQWPTQQAPMVTKPYVQAAQQMQQAMGQPAEPMPQQDPRTAFRRFPFMQQQGQAGAAFNNQMAMNPAARLTAMRRGLLG